ncbi:hypothetical protein FACS1894139_13200 [Planctomycetales bacterium]|nr:hypothetical protein FACS1894107_05030 [Planctomycetales bacterium]GHS99908.1 hypothetical protein FACS1894108_10820 [Planctomycetales bacterium]GHT06707.1 hypothetical protein FACS1894139_13200 [Planctomycetales bacterium]
MPFPNHPCFNPAARHRVGRIHLPVAAECNVQCNFCNRDYACVNESRPGVTGAVLTPEAAADYLDAVLVKIPTIAVVGVAGPGDPFASPAETLATLRLVRERHPEKILCLASNGLAVAEHAAALADLNVSHVTLTVNAVDPEIGAQIYAWIRVPPHLYRGAAGAAVLLERQTAALTALAERGITVKVNTVVIPGVNEQHAAAVAAYAAKHGAQIQNCIPLMRVNGSAFVGVEPPTNAAMQETRRQAGEFLPQMSHCGRCRADAAGMLGENNSPVVGELLTAAAKKRD